MTTPISFIVFLQTFGACIGIFTVVWGEYSYIHAMRDGVIDAAERAHLHIIGIGLRFGMTILLLSSSFFVASEYVLHSALQPALTENYWIFIAFAFLIIGISWALSRRYILFTLGSAAIMTAWWLLLYLSLGRLWVHSFESAIALYTVLTVVVYGVLRYIHFLVLDNATKHFT
ncbi:MAG: hypothetical protein WC887_00495 [Candidatus Paceibacterota bacterium]|jgi:hypothetical protein